MTFLSHLDSFSKLSLSTISEVMMTLVVFDLELVDGRLSNKSPVGDEDGFVLVLDANVVASVSMMMLLLLLTLLAVSLIGTD